MKKTHKILGTTLLCGLALGGWFIFAGCASNKDNEDKNLCTVSYNLNFEDTDYSVLKSFIDNGLSFNVDGFIQQKNIVETGIVDIVYTKQIECGRGFILYEFEDKVLNTYFEGWYTSSGARVDELNSTVNNDITLYAKWKEDLKSLTTYSGGTDFEYTFNEVNQTASFKNAEVNNYHNNTGVITLPELVFNNGKFYVVNNIAYNYSREHLLYFVPKTYTGSIYYPIIFPNKDELGDDDLTYLGNYISERVGTVICIYEANYTTNTLTLKYIEKGSALSNNPYLTLGKNINICRDGETQRTLKITDFYSIYPMDGCPYTNYIISKDLTDEFPEFTNVLQNNNNNPIHLFYEFTKEELEQMGRTVWPANGIIQGSMSYINETEVCYYYSETEPTQDEYNYWHYVNGKVVIWE